EIADLGDADAFDDAIDIVGTWSREDKRAGTKTLLQALIDKRIGRRDQAQAWVWRLASYTRDLHEEYAVQRWPETKRLLGLLVNSSGRAHGRNARRLVHAARKQDRRLAVSLLAAAVSHTPEGEEVLRGARMRMARKPSGVARELLRNFPKGGKRRRRRGKRNGGGENGEANGSVDGAAEGVEALELAGAEDADELRGQESVNGGEPEESANGAEPEAEADDGGAEEPEEQLEVEPAEEAEDAAAKPKRRKRTVAKAAKSTKAEKPAKASKARKAAKPAKAAKATRRRKAAKSATGAGSDAGQMDLAGAEGDPVSVGETDE
ncbi:MAG: hypothetical protein JST31_16380, partial [Actinobacteria bacterium]|nr:hypothetical protein [Actinomycetota bacterium]